jgi:hypothetical protein
MTKEERMDIGLTVAKGLVTLVALITMISGALADMVIPVTARQHFRNPSWPPHAKFHNGQTVWLGGFLGALALALTWLTDDFQLAVLVSSFIWLSMLGASMLPGTRWTDPEFEDGGHRGVAPQLRLALALLVLLLGAEVAAVW